MTWRSIVPVTLAFVLCTAVSSGVLLVAEQAAPASLDIASVEMGGRAEWFTDEDNASSQDAAANLIARTRNYGWAAMAGALPQEMVFSFFSRQSALVAGLEINPTSDCCNGSAKDIEVWISTQSPTEGFTKVAAATLKPENSLQPIAFTPVEARFVKLRILSAGGPAGHRMGMRRLRILEGQRPGYTSILVRNPDLAALVKGVLPSPPTDAAGPPPPPAGRDSCPAPPASGKARYPQSRNVLLINGSAGVQRPFVTDPFNLKKANLLKPAISGITLQLIAPEVLAPAILISEPRIDTIVLGQVCRIRDVMSKEFKQALVAWVAAGHKLIIQDSDACAQSPDYSFLPYPFKTVNPGSAGARGTAGILEDSALISSRKGDPAYVDMDAWKEGPNDMGDSNIIIEWDARWCGAAWSKNRLQKSGFALAYAHYGRGLIIYDGFDYDQAATKYYRQLIQQEILLPFDPDPLTCSNPLGSFTLATDNSLRSQPMAANKTYNYPLSVFGNYGYSGRVTLEAVVSPADPGVTARLQNPVADLTKVDEAATSLSVTTTATASLKEKTIMVRGRDAAGKTNTVCFALPERRTGSISVISLLRQNTADKKPTKNLEIILDASGSMKALLGKQTRWAVAQSVLKDVVSKLPKDFSLGLRAYGHTLPSTNPGTCKDTALVVPVAANNHANLLAAAAKLAPRGETPLVYSALQSIADLKAAGGGTVILITDGEESCKGDFAAAAKAMKDSGLNFTLNIVGFTLKNAPAQAALSSLAESTGGHYYSASSGDALARAVLLAAVDKLPYRIVDAAGKEVGRGEAGATSAHELAPGTYRVIVSAADQEITTPVTIALNQDVTLRASVKGDKVVVEK